MVRLNVILTILLIKKELIKEPGNLPENGKINHNYLMGSDVRWKQRLIHYQKALGQFKENVLLYRSRPLNNIEKQGLIKSFEFTHELAWNVIKDFFFYQGNSSIMGSRDASREAFSKGLIEDGGIWMKMIESRNETVHSYNIETVEKILELLDREYYSAFEQLDMKMSKLAEDD